ncbi:MAG: VanZ family protein [Clostridiaceae bacterium]|jgi:glycopeptide antibiotics resistance protein|nr:VanZ family protein [Clostridiaceae bacterium]
MINKKRNVVSIFIMSFVFSTVIELMQLLTMIIGIARPGRCFDVDDIIANTLGGLFGYLAYKFAMKIVYTRTPEYKKQGRI